MVNGKKMPSVNGKKMTIVTEKAMESYVGFGVKGFSQGNSFPISTSGGRKGIKVIGKI